MSFVVSQKDRISNLIDLVDRVDIELIFSGSVQTLQQFQTIHETAWIIEDARSSIPQDLVPFSRSLSIFFREPIQIGKDVNASRYGAHTKESFIGEDPQVVR